MSGTRDWSNLQVSPSTRRFIEETGFKRMTPVQAIAIPLLMNHRDVAVEACTGSGKTLAFLVPIVEILLRCEAPRVLPFSVGCAILAPTRELTGQIHEVLGSFLEAVGREDEAAGARLRRQLFVGGSDAKAAVDAISRLDDRGRLQIVVATPGRLRAIMTLAGKERLNLKALEVLVLDEADRLLQLGFSSDLDVILSAVPKQRRTGLFSATLTSELQRLMKTGMRNPVHVCVRRKAAAQPPDAAAAAEGVAAVADGADGSSAAPAAPLSGGQLGHELPTKLLNYSVTVPAQRKLSFLVEFLQRPEVRSGKTIIFFLSCACVDFFHTLLRDLIDRQGGLAFAKATKKKGKKGKQAIGAASPKGGRIEKLHGQMDQTARRKAYDKFCRSSLDDGAVLLATDLAARGIDVAAVGWVVQFDAPVDPAAFVHRIGRAARAGLSGNSLIMLMPSEDSYVPYLQKRSVAIEELPESLGGGAGGSSGSTAPSPQDDPVLCRGRQLLETDRAVMLKGSKAFVSFVRAYQEHQLPFLFPFKSLDMGGLATSFCLLRMPRMKEILGKRMANFVQSEVNPASVPFKDKAQEKQRQTTLKRKREEAEAEDAAVKAAREREAAKAKAKAKAEAKPRTRTQKRQAKRNERADEWTLLAAEERLAKKLRRGQITAKQFQTGVKKATLKQADDDGGGGGAGGSDDSSGETPCEESDDGEDTRYLTKRRKKRRGKCGKH